MARPGDFNLHPTEIRSTHSVANKTQPETVMKTDLSTANTLNNDRRLFHAHVVAVVLTAAVVAPLLLGVASIPLWVSVACCSIITSVALAFVAAAVNRARAISGRSVYEGVEYLVVPLALAMLQMIFVLPVLICIFAPTFRA
jgi:hypothetical protein